MESPEQKELDFFGSCPVCFHPAFHPLHDLGRVHVFRCGRCRMMFLNPYLKAGSMEKIFSSTEELVKVSPFFQHYFEERAWQTPKTAAIYRKCLTELEYCLPSKGSLLDVGCGRGTFLKLAKDRGWRVQGVETNRDSVKMCREEFGIEVTGEEFLAIRDSSHKWDVIALWDLIEHVPNPGEWVKQCYDRIKTGGVLVIATPNHHSFLDMVSSLAYRLSRGLVRSGLSKLYTIDHTLYFTEETLKWLLEREGFRVLKAMKVNTDLERYSMSPWFRFFAECLLAVSHVLHLQNRILMIARKA